VVAWICSVLVEAEYWTVEYDLPARHSAERQQRP